MSEPLAAYVTGRDGEDVEVFDFTPRRRKVTLTAKWWMRPICWVLRRPTTRTVMW